LPSSGEHIFGSIAAFFALDDGFLWGLISYKGLNIHLSYFSPLISQKPKILGPFSDLEKLQLKILNNGDAHLQTTLNRHRSLTKVA